MPHDTQPYCPHCGEPAEEIVEVLDDDPSSGYHAIELMCPGCIQDQRDREAVQEGGLDPLVPLSSAGIQPTSETSFAARLHHYRY